MKVMIHSYNLIGTKLVIHEAWEKASWMSHSSIRHFDGELYGRVNDRRLPRVIEDLPPGSDQRIEAVHKWQSALDRLTKSVLVKAMPFLREDGRWVAGAMTEMCAAPQFAARMNKSFEFEFKGPLIQSVEVNRV